MYEGYLQHDAQEVLQCILGYIQEASDTIRKEQGLNKDNTTTEVKNENESSAESKSSTEDENQVGSKRKSDTEVGNAKKKPKSVDTKKADAEEEIRNKPVTRSKRRSSGDVTLRTQQAEDAGMKKLHKEEETESDSEAKGDDTSKQVDGKRKKKLSWLRPSGKQPSIFSKFRRVGKISSSTVKLQDKPEQENELSEGQRSSETSDERLPQNVAAHKKAVRSQGMTCCYLDIFCIHNKCTQVVKYK